MSEAQLRAAIVAEAISWERTPYEGHQRVKGVAVDCAQLPVAVYSEIGAMPVIEPQYSQQWMLHHDEELYLAEVMRFSREIPVENVQPGDLIVWKWGRTYSHSAIVIDPPLVIHAALRGGAVIRADYSADERLKTHPKRAFSVFAEDGSGFVYQGPF